MPSIICFVFFLVGVQLALLDAASNKLPSFVVFLEMLLALARQVSELPLSFKL